jgi:hypothetical protein
MLREFNPKFRPWRRGRNLQPPSLQCAGSLRKQAQWQTGQGIVVAFGLATLDVHALAFTKPISRWTSQKCGSRYLATRC